LHLQGTFSLCYHIVTELTCHLFEKLGKSFFNKRDCRPQSDIENQFSGPVNFVLSKFIDKCFTATQLIPHPIYNLRM